MIFASIEWRCVLFAVNATACTSYSQFAAHALALTRCHANKSVNRFDSFSPFRQWKLLGDRLERIEDRRRHTDTDRKGEVWRIAFAITTVRPFVMNVNRIYGQNVYK